MAFHFILYLSLSEIVCFDGVIKASEEDIASLGCFTKSDTGKRELDLDVSYYFSLS